MGASTQHGKRHNETTTARGPSAGIRWQRRGRGQGPHRHSQGRFLISGLELNFDKTANSWVINITILMQRGSFKDPKGLGHIRNLSSPKDLHQSCPIELQ